MKNDYDIRVLTNKDLGDPDFIKKLLNAWCYGIDSRLKPEFFGSGEPVRHSFAEKGVAAALKMWVKEGLGLLLRRRSESGYLTTIDWWRREETLDTRPFPWSCSVSLRRKAGDELALRYFEFLIEWFEPAFGHLSTNNQIDLKHFAYVEDATGSVEQYVGLDIGDKLPGIYWITYFGQPLVERIGANKFSSLSSAKVEKFKKGFLVKAYPSSKEIGSQTAKVSESLILQHLGRHHFFDKSQFDLSSLLLDEETEGLIDEKIKKIKSVEDK